MGASKTKIYTFDEKELALMGRALSHPARVRIFNILKEKPFVRNCELTKDLKLCKKTVHDHLKKMEEASIIQSEFMMNSLYISKRVGAEERIVEFLTNKRL